MTTCPACGFVLSSIHGDEWWCERCPWGGTERDRQAAAKPDSRDTGSALVSLLLAVCIAGGLLGLLLLGQQAMCAVHTTPGERPIYCETAGAQR
jgi:hypothetical protein